MAIVYGKPARGGIEHLAESAINARIVPSPPDQAQPKVALLPSSWGNIFFRVSVSLLVAIATLGISVYLVALIFPEAQLIGPVVVFLVTYLVLRRTKTDYWAALQGVPESTKTHHDAALDYVNSVMHKLLNGADIDDFPFENRDKAVVIGSLGEIRTARELEKNLDDSFGVVNDITLIKNGRTTANIDHLVLGSNGMFMVDSKVWSAPLKPEKRGDYTYLPKNSPHWNSVSTCLYEASFLPDAPRAIVFSVSGKAGWNLEKNPLTLDGYVPRFSDDDTVLKLSIPVVFVRQKDIARHILQLDSSIPQRDTIDIEDIRDTDSLSFAD